MKANFDVKVIDGIIKDYGCKKSALISILQDVQNKYNWLPQDILRYIAQALSVSLTDIFGIVTFYKSFSLEPRGKHIIKVCLGTACHVRGGARILDGLEQTLAIKEGETTKDGQFTLEVVNCFGCCAIGPIMVVDGEPYGEMNVKKANSILTKCRDEEETNEEEK